MSRHVRSDCGNPVRWNPWNKVVQDHRTGEIDRARTDEERARRGLPTPWQPEWLDHELPLPAVV